jgi:hypothetical protein
MESEELLPHHLLMKANLKGLEYAWRKEDIREVIFTAKEYGLACLGGNVQFRIPDGTCDLYWLEYWADDRKPDESWRDFVSRSADECYLQIENMVNTKDIVREAYNGFSILKEMAQKVDISIYMWFILYFDTEEKYLELCKKK